MRSGKYVPGRRTPGLRTPGATTPGSLALGMVEDAEVSGTVEVDSTGQTELGVVSGDRVRVKEVTVDPDVDDFSFNVLVSGVTVFSEAQSPEGGDVQSFTPDGDGRVTVSGSDESVEVEVTSASGTGGATTSVIVDTVADDQ